MTGHWGDVDISAAERVHKIMDANGATPLPFSGRSCDCPHPDTPQCCINQLGLR